MEYCAVFYTAEEASEYIAGTFEPLETRYAMHSPPMNPLKGALREAAFRLNPRLGDCFLVAARRR
jgi:acyl transferase domain-containing protein